MTVDMMMTIAPVISLEHKFADRLPMKVVHIIAAIMFVLLGGLVLGTVLYPAKHTTI
jgi:Ca2+/H+ antiporter, TMEM165/GDT1 family